MNAMKDAHDPRETDDATLDSATTPRAPRVCALLRTKMAFGSLEPGAPDWQTGDDSTAVYWCLQTMETSGVDQGYAHPHECRPGRVCFVKPVD